MFQTHAHLIHFADKRKRITTVSVHPGFIRIQVYTVSSRTIIWLTSVPVLVVPGWPICPHPCTLHTQMYSTYCKRDTNVSNKTYHRAVHIAPTKCIPSSWFPEYFQNSNKEISWLPFATLYSRQFPTCNANKTRNFGVKSLKFNL